MRWCIYAHMCWRTENICVHFVIYYIDLVGLYNLLARLSQLMTTESFFESIVLYIYFRFCFKYWFIMLFYNFVKLVLLINLYCTVMVLMLWPVKCLELALVHISWTSNKQKDSTAADDLPLFTVHYSVIYAIHHWLIPLSVLC